MLLIHSRRSASSVLLQAGGAAAAVVGDAEARVVSQAVGVVLVAPALAEQQQVGAQQVGQRIGDGVRVARIDQPPGHPLHDAGALHDLAQQQRAGVGAEMIRPRLDLHAAVEGRRKDR